MNLECVPLLYTRIFNERELIIRWVLADAHSDLWRLDSPSNPCVNCSGHVRNSLRPSRLTELASCREDRRTCQVDLLSFQGDTGFPGDTRVKRNGFSISIQDFMNDTERA